MSLIHLKADDTYLQLKKDLEYLDLKVSAGRSVASVDSLHLGVPSSANVHPGLTQPGSPKKVLLCEPEFCFVLFFFCILQHWALLCFP